MNTGVDDEKGCREEQMRSDKNQAFVGTSCRQLAKIIEYWQRQLAACNGWQGLCSAVIVEAKSGPAIVV